MKVEKCVKFIMWHVTGKLCKSDDCPGSHSLKHGSDVCGCLCMFPQQLMSVRLTEGLTGDMTVLGNVTHKLVCSPDFEALLQVETPLNSYSLSKS